MFLGFQKKNNFVLLLILVSFILWGCNNQIGSYQTQETKNQNETQEQQTSEEQTALRLGDRHYTASVLSSIFSSNVEATNIIETLITNQVQLFGGPCDPYNLTLDGEDWARECQSIQDQQVTKMMSNSPVREAYRIRACLEIASSDSAITTLILRMRQLNSSNDPNFLKPMSQGEAQQLYNYFFPFQDLESSLAREIVDIAEEVRSNSTGNSKQNIIDSFAIAFDLICSATPSWQIH